VDWEDIHTALHAMSNYSTGKYLHFSPLLNYQHSLGFV